MSNLNHRRKRHGRHATPRPKAGPLPMTPIEEPGKGHKIDWLNRPGTVPRTWNPIIGCRRVSAGCDHCYAHRMARRLAAMAAAELRRGADPGRKIHYRLVEQWDGSTVTIRHALDDPAAWSKPATVFVGSMGDLFCRSVSDRDRGWVWDAMARHPRHTFLVLTKRPHLAAGFLADRDVLPNVWVGTSIEDQPAADARLPHLAELTAAVLLKVGTAAPDSPGRILRQLRRRGSLAYTVVDRPASRYRFDGFAVKQKTLFDRS